MEGHRMTEQVWKWWTDRVYAGGGVKTEPFSNGSVYLSDAGLVVDPDDDFYGGTISKTDAVDLARAILARFGET
jgi:hypothetical protein